MRLLKHFVLGLGIVLSVDVFSQEDRRQNLNFIIEPRLHYGLVIPFYDAIKYLVHDNATGFELLLGFPTYGKDFWEKLYRYPRVGAGYSCWNLGNKKIFGTAHALFGFFNAPVLELNDKLSVNYQISFGAWAVCFGHPG